MSSSPNEPQAARGPWWEPLPWFAGCLLVYAALIHDTFYKTDGPDVARLLDDHLQARAGAAWPHPWHVGYLPALDGFRRLLGAFGVVPGWLQLGGWFSALGCALGVAFGFAGMRRLAPAPVARLGALLLAANPGTVLFATVVEYHGPVQAPLGLAFWWTTVQIGRPTWWGMLVLAACCHGAFLIHGQALFYPAFLLPFLVAWRWTNGTRAADVGFAALAGGAHAAAWLAAPRLWPAAYGMWADLGAGLATESSIGRPQSLDWTPAILWQEWLWPLLPVSLLVIGSPLRRALRGQCVAFAIGFLPLLWMSVRQLVFEPEYGAYLLPMVLPASFLVAQAAGGRWRAAVALAIPLGLLPVELDQRAHLRAQRAIDDGFAARIAAAAQGAEPFVLVGSHRELAAAYARLGARAAPPREPSDLRFLWVRENATMPREQATPAHLAGVETLLRALHAAGRAVLITGPALASLDDPAAAMLAEQPTLPVPANELLAGPLFAAHLRARFAIEPAGPDLFSLVPRP